MPDRAAAVAKGPVALIAGQRWSLAIVAALTTGPQRFGALKAAVPGISADLLTRRLEELTSAGILQPVVLRPPASVAAYALTGWGAELGPILIRLKQWASRGEHLSNPRVHA